NNQFGAESPRSYPRNNPRDNPRNNAYRRNYQGSEGSRRLIRSQPFSVHRQRVQQLTQLVRRHSGRNDIIEIGYPTGAIGFLADAERLHSKRLERKSQRSTPDQHSMGQRADDRPTGLTLEEIVTRYTWSEPFEGNQFWIRFVQGGEQYYYTPYFHDLRIEFEDGSYERGDSSTQRFRDWWNVSGPYANEDDDREQGGNYGEEEEYSESVHRDADPRGAGNDLRRWEEREFAYKDQIPYYQGNDDDWQEEERREYQPEPRYSPERQSSRHRREDQRQNRTNQRRSNPQG